MFDGQQQWRWQSGTENQFSIASIYSHFLRPQFLAFVTHLHGSANVVAQRRCEPALMWRS